MPGNKRKQRIWGMNKHPIFAILKVDILAGIKVCLEIFRMNICKCGVFLCFTECISVSEE